jgi:hypothetical protein
MCQINHSHTKHIRFTSLKIEKMNQLKIFVVLLLSVHVCFGQMHFEVKNSSSNYSIQMFVDTCFDGHCEGKGTIKLIDKKTNKIFQTLYADDLYFYLDSTQNPTVNIIQLYDEQSPLIFEDFNFDGSVDLAIRNGNNSSYSGPSYDVYVFHATKKQFVFSDELTTLAVENLGMFQTDSKRKRIITFAKSGCCWHITTEYAVVPQKGLKKVYEFEEDALGGENVVVTTRKLINNKWISKSKKYKISEYYKN